MKTAGYILAMIILHHNTQQSAIYKKKKCQQKEDSLHSEELLQLQFIPPVTKVLNKIQGKEQAYLGTLLPTVVTTIFRLKGLKSKGLIYYSPLVDALLAGSDKSFRTLLEDEDCQLAAAFHPRFRLIWLAKYDNTKVAKVKKSMEGKVKEVMRQQPDKVSNNSGGSSNEKQVDDFLSSVTQPKESSRIHRSLKDKAQNLVKTWLETSSKELLTDAAFLGEQVLMDLFIKFNTVLQWSVCSLWARTS
ncbi:uncharacterized protein LOC118763785 [Octopus sinensis]|uniref:Uncharacterized protein LOC118763785 n=1 Tax=Octopus sinensis TaxID=2607531 RepID=A0A7E6EWT6_9MOLL|nr:uncharacterized protein LOC118763785 [Octopus sinensis]